MLLLCAVLRKRLSPVLTVCSAQKCKQSYPICKKQKEQNLSIHCNSDTTLRLLSHLTICNLCTVPNSLG